MDYSPKTLKIGLCISLTFLIIEVTIMARQRDYAWPGLLALALVPVTLLTAAYFASQMFERHFPSSRSRPSPRE